MSSDNAELGTKIPFRWWGVSGAQIQLAMQSPRTFFFVKNEGGPSVLLGNASGTVKSQGFVLPSGAVFSDEYSDDEWWFVETAGASGSVAGYVVSE